MFCKYCGNELKEEAKFCTKCGKAVEVKDLPKAESIAPKETFPKANDETISKQVEEKKKGMLMSSLK